MATKDWRLDSENGMFKTWSHKKYPATTIFFGKYTGGKWFVEVSDPNPKKILKPHTRQFINRSTAEKYINTVKNKKLAKVKSIYD